MVPFFSSWADWDEDEPEPTMCLFEEVVLASPKEALDHMRDIHGFDLSKVKAEKGEFVRIEVLSESILWLYIALTLVRPHHFTSPPTQVLTFTRLSS